MRTQAKITTDSELVCVADHLATNFETKNWLLEDQIKIGDRLKVVTALKVAGNLMVKPSGKLHFHPHQKFLPTSSFISLDKMTFLPEDVGRKIQIKGKHYLSYSTSYGSGDKITAVTSLTYKTYTIAKINPRSIVLEGSSIKNGCSTRLSYSVNASFASKISVRFV